MDVTPKRAQKPPAAYVWGLVASAEWLVGWPVWYAYFYEGPKSATYIWLTHAAATIWFFSLIVLFVCLAALKEYSRIIAFMWDALIFVVNLLSFLVWF